MTDPTSEPGFEPPRSAMRQLALGTVVFVATLGLLWGIGAIVRGASGTASGPTSATDPSRPAASVVVASPSASATPSATARPSASGGPSGSPGPSESPQASGLPVDPILLGAGDIAACDNDGDAETAAVLVGQDGVVFTAGDNAYPNGTAQQFADCYDPTWGQVQDRTRPVPGNHDHETAGLAGYLGYFGAAAAPDGHAWYSYDLGTWHVVALDATCSAAGGCGPDSAQGRWLSSDLAASDATCTLAIWHQPRFSSGEHGDDATVAPFWDALYTAGADLVVNGHDHDYERFAPQDPAGRADPTRGMREFVVGTGGAELTDFRAEHVANSELRVAGYLGILRLVLHHASFEWSFITTSGVVLDAGNGTCH